MRAALDGAQQLVNRRYQFHTKRHEGFFNAATLRFQA
jgi:hypothetical protein